MKKLKVEDLKAPGVIAPKVEEKKDPSTMTKAELLAIVEELSKKKTRTANENSFAAFLKPYYMAVGEDGVTCKYTTDEMFDALKEKYPDWKSEGRKWYISWYRSDLRKKIPNVPLNNSLKKEKTPKAARKAASKGGETTSTFKAVKDMTAEERLAYITERNIALKAEGKALLPLPGSVEASLPAPTKKVKRGKK